MATVLHPTRELNGSTERCLKAQNGLARTAEEVRTEASRLVRYHAARLGMDGMAADVLARAIEAL